MNLETLKHLVQKRMYSLTTNRDDSLIEFTVKQIDEQVKVAIRDHTLKTGKFIDPSTRHIMYEAAVDSIIVNE